MPNTLRPTLVPLIARLRRELGVCADSYDDETLADTLDARRTSVFKMRLDAALEQGTGVVDYTIHYADSGDWEVLALYDEHSDTITEDQIALAEPFVGMWRFLADQRTVYLTGYRHEIAGAAADMWQRRASDLAHQCDTSSGDVRLSLSQAVAHAQERAAAYLRRTRPRNVRASRSDVARGSTAAQSWRAQRW